MKIIITWVQGLRALIVLTAFSIFGYGAYVHDITWAYIALIFLGFFVMFDTMLINRKR